MSSTKTQAFSSSAVAEAFTALPDAPRERLLELRSLIFTVANASPEIGPLEEALGWGEPSYLTSQTKSGTTVRIHWKARDPEHCALYVNCRTELVERFRERHSDTLLFADNRAVLFRVDAPLPRVALENCVQLAFTYHLRGLC